MATLASGCLDPLVDDEIPPNQILPAGTEVPSLYLDPTIAAQVADNDGVDGLIPLVSGFSDGQFIRYWDFGPAPDFAQPIFVFVRLTENGPQPLPIKLVDSIPGQDNYSPFWSMFRVPVTNLYADEVIASVEAMQEAQRIGLVGEPEQLNVYLNCAIVFEDVRMQMGGETPDREPGQIYFRGTVARVFDFSASPAHGLRPLGGDGIRVPTADRYTLAREGELPLSEVARGVDITGDGDTVDTNDILASGHTGDQYTPLRRSVEVTVPSDYLSIDAGNETQADFRDVADLFTSTDGEFVPVPGNVLAVDVPDASLRNQPIQSAPGAL